MIKPHKIEWNGFLEECEKEYPKEICAWIFTDERRLR